MWLFKFIILNWVLIEANDNSNIMESNIEERKNEIIEEEDTEEKRVLLKSFLINEEEGVKHNWSGRHYVILAFGAGLLFGTTNFLYECKLLSESSDFYLVLYLPIFFG